MEGNNHYELLFSLQVASIHRRQLISPKIALTIEHPG